MSLECSRQQDSASKGSSQESGEECNVCHFDQQSEQWLAADVVGGGAEVISQAEWEGL